MNGLIYSKWVSGRPCIAAKYNDGVSGHFMLYVSEDGKIVFHRETEPFGLHSKRRLTPNTYTHVAASFGFGKTARSSIWSNHSFVTPSIGPFIHFVTPSIGGKSTSERELKGGADSTVGFEWTRSLQDGDIHQRLGGRDGERGQGRSSTALVSVSRRHSRSTLKHTHTPALKKEKEN